MNEEMKKIVEKYNSQLLNLLYELAEVSCGGEQITINSSVGNIKITINEI